MIKILEKYGGWPLVEGEDWESRNPNWNWVEINEKISRDGLPGSLFPISIEVNPIDTSRHILAVSIWVRTGNDNEKSHGMCVGGLKKTFNTSIDL